MLTFSTQGKQIPQKTWINMQSLHSQKLAEYKTASKPFERKTEFGTLVAQIGKFLNFFPENSACHPHFCRLGQVFRESTADKMH